MNYKSISSGKISSKISSIPTNLISFILSIELSFILFIKSLLSESKFTFSITSLTEVFTIDNTEIVYFSLS